MASNVLKTLQGLEQDRQNLILTARSNGFNVNDDASISSIGNYIGTKSLYEDPMITTPCKNTDLWVRPSEWPDCHQILLDTEPIVSGSRTYYPFIIFLISGIEDTIVIPQVSYANIGQGASVTDDVKHGCQMVLLSDGTEYDVTSAGVTHTWDKSKDIVVTEGKYPGTYRYVIGFSYGYSGNISIGNAWPIVEIIEDKGSAGSNLYFPVFVVSPYSGSYGYGRYLLNVEIYDIYNSNNLWYGASGGYSIFSYLPYLRNLYIKQIGVLKCRASNPPFKGLYSLERLDISNLIEGCEYEDTIIDLSLTSNIRYISLPPVRTKTGNITNFKVTLGYNPRLETIIGGNNTIIGWGKDWASYYGATGYCPQDVSVIGCRLANYPNNWNNSTLKPISSYGYNYNFVGLNVRTLDLTSWSFSSSTSNCNIYVNSTSYWYFYSTSNILSASLYYPVNTLILPNNISYRLDLTIFFLTRECLVDIFNKLKDISEETEPVYNARIKIGQNILQLTEEDIEIATNKGWSVIVY